MFMRGKIKSHHSVFSGTYLLSLKVLIMVLVISFFVFSATSARAQYAAEDIERLINSIGDAISPSGGGLPVNNVGDSAIHVPIVNGLEALGRVIVKALQDSAAQSTVSQAASDSYAANRDTALTADRAASDLANAKLKSLQKLSGRAQLLCPLVSSTKGLATMAAAANEKYRQRIASSNSILGGKNPYGDGPNALAYDINTPEVAQGDGGELERDVPIIKRSQVCSEDELGGDLQGAMQCQGPAVPNDPTKEFDYLSVSSILGDSIIDKEEVINAEYIRQNLIGVATFQKLLPFFTVKAENFSTDTKLLLAQMDQFRQERSILGHAIASAVARRQESEFPIESTQWAREILLGKDSDSVSPAYTSYVDALLPENNKPSLISYFEGLAYGFMNPDYFTQQGTGNQEAYLVNIMQLLAVNNILQVEQLKVLENIAFATAGTYASNGNEYLERLNRSIQSLNLTGVK